MARPTTKIDLITAANEQFAKMWTLIDSMTQDEQLATLNFGDDFNKTEAHWERDKNLRDVLIHLYEWHQLLMKWITSNTAGDNRPFLPEAYNWKTYGVMNIEFRDKHQSTSYEDAKQMLIDSHEAVLNLIEPFSNDALFSKKHFTWTGTTTLGSYCVSATASHYDWAIKKIKQHIKTIR